MEKEGPKYLVTLLGILVMAFLYTTVQGEITGNYVAQPTQTSATVWSWVETGIIVFIMGLTTLILYARLSRYNK